jgi:hypothetical protein
MADYPRRFWHIYALWKLQILHYSYYVQHLILLDTICAYHLKKEINCLTQSYTAFLENFITGWSRHRSQRFISMCHNAHLSASIQSTYSHPICLRSTSIPLYLCLSFPRHSNPWSFLTKVLYTYLLSHLLHIPRLSLSDLTILTI